MRTLCFRSFLLLWMTVASIVPCSADAPASNGVSTGANATRGPLPNGIRPILGVQIDTQAITDGLLVDAVMPASIAVHMGLKPGDILLELNGTPLTSMEVFHHLLGALRHGDRLKVQYRHGSEVITREDNLSEVPVLPTYNVVEGHGLPQVLWIGATRAQIEKTLGKPAGEMESNGITYLAYPFHGITVGLLPGQGEPRVATFSMEYPFVGQTSHGLSTHGDVSAIATAYKGQVIDTQRLSIHESMVSIVHLGIRFRAVDGRIVKVQILPPQERAALPTPSDGTHTTNVPGPVIPTPP